MNMFENKTCIKGITDVHTHTAFSADSSTSIEEMLFTAKEKGVTVYGVSDHFEHYERGYGRYWTKPELYFPRAREIQKEYEGKMTVLVGAEIGFRSEPNAVVALRKMIETYRPDFIVNSVHGISPALQEKDGKLPDKYQTYEWYLNLILKSLDAEYDYDIVGHIGFCVRYADYKDRSMRYETHKETFDKIIRKIIEKDKILEVNGKLAPARFEGDTPISFVPERDFLKAYYKAGGRLVSYASDAHSADGILQGREEIIKTLKEIGFTHLTVPCQGKRIQAEI